MEQLRQESARESQAREREKAFRQEELVRQLEERQHQATRRMKSNALELDRQRYYYYGIVAVCLVLI